MSALAERTGAINLGQGFPDEDGPAVMIDAAVKAMRDGRNQYPPGPGIPELRQAISAHQQRFYGLAYDPDTGVLVTAGCARGDRPGRLCPGGPRGRGGDFGAVLRLLRPGRGHGRSPTSGGAASTPEVGL